MVESADTNPVTVGVQDTIDYEAFLADAPRGALADVVAFLSEELPYAWLDAYERVTQRSTTATPSSNERAVFLIARSSRTA